MDYILHLLIFVLLYGMVALSLNVTSGYTRLVSLAHATFFGIGAYTAAILATKFGTSMWLSLPVGMVIASLVAIPVASMAFRMAEDYFIICTMGFGVVLYSLMNNWMELTHGPLGIPGIPSASFFGQEFAGKWEWLLLVTVFYGAIFCVVRNLKCSAFGRLLMAISEDEVFCQSLGKNVWLAKFQSFVLGAMLAAVPGVLYARYVSFIDPTSFTIQESIFFLSVIIIGGMGNLLGSLAAVAFMILIPELLRFVGLPSDIAANVRQMLFGGTLVLAVYQQCIRKNIHPIAQ